MNVVSKSVTPQPTDIGLLAWLNQAQPGDALEYHRGFLAVDRARETSALREDDRQVLLPNCEPCVAAVESSV